MIKGGLTPALPNPHTGDTGIGLIARILRQAQMDKDE